MRKFSLEEVSSEIEGPQIAGAGASGAFKMIDGYWTRTRINGGDSKEDAW